jgi:hypothetical protein
MRIELRHEEDCPNGYANKRARFGIVPDGCCG